MLLIFHLCDDVTSWRHVMTSQNLIYLSQLPDVLESWFFFVSMIFWVTEFINVIDFSFVWWRDVMTSCHDVTKPDLPISASRCARKLILFLFPWFFRSLSPKMLSIFHLCDDMTSWRHVMTSTKPDLPISASRSARKLILVCFHGFLGHWVQKYCLFFICVMTWRPWRHVVTSRQYLSSPYSICWSCNWAIVRFQYKCHANLRCWYQANHQYCFCKLPPACHNVASWRHNVTSCHCMKLKQH